MGPLIRLTTKSGDADVRKGALQRLLAIASINDEPMAERGGRAAVALRMQDAIDDVKLDQVLSLGEPVRRGAARELDALLRDGHTPGWLLEFVLQLSDDPGEKIGDSVIFGVAYGPIEELVRNREFFSRLLDTRAAIRNLSTIVEGCDRAAQLLPVADQIVELAMKAIHPRDDDVEYWRRCENTRRAVNALARLVEEAERESCFDVRTKALDAWDALIEAGEAVAVDAFDERVTDI